MPSRLTVAILTQPLRIDACLAYMRGATENVRFVVFTGDPGAFAGLDVPAGTEIRSGTSPGGVLLDPARAAKAGRRRLLGWMRSGSRLGRLTERMARRVLTILRPPKPVTGPATGAPPAPINEHLAGELARLHESEPISEIVLFDVFDLPTALPFAESNTITLLVR